MKIRLTLSAVVLLPVAAISGEQVAKLVQGDASDSSGQWTLTSQQLAYTESWVRDRSLNCLAGAGSPPAPAIHLHLVRSDGTKLELGLYSQPGYAKVVETHVGSNLCHYQGSEADVAALRDSIGRPR
jgi:hypothetical protein